MQAQAADHDAYADRDRHHGAQLHPVVRRRRWSAAIFLFRWWARARFGAGEDRPGEAEDCRSLGEIWLKYQVAQFSRVLSTLLTGGIPLVQATGNGGRFAGHAAAAQGAGEGGQDGARRAAAFGLADSDRRCFPALAIDMIEVGESTGALPAMLTSVAEFYEEDVNTQDDGGALADRAGDHDLHGDRLWRLC